MPKSRSKNKHIRTFSLSTECLEALAQHKLSHESKSATVERLIMQQAAFLNRRHPQNTLTAPTAPFPSDSEPTYVYD